MISIMKKISETESEVLRKQLMTDYLNLSEARNRNIHCRAIIQFPLVSKSPTTDFICLQEDLALLVSELACRFGGDILN